jgi:hypothetical protein
MTQLSDEVVETAGHAKLMRALDAALGVIRDAGGFDDVPAVQFARETLAEAKGDS